MSAADPAPADQPRAARHTRRRVGPCRCGDRGFTLVEVLVAGVILSVIGVSLVRCWTVFDGLTFDLVLRQKAALVLNGEMERLWVVYTRTAFGNSDSTRSDYPAVTGLNNSATRVSYSSNTATSSFVTTAPATFAAQATPDATVFLGAGSPPLNWVWLDRPRNLVARLSWQTCAVQVGNVSACWTGSNSGQGTASACIGYSGSGTAPCELLIAILEYPYAFNDGSPQAVGTTRSLTLATVVGRRL